MIPASAGSYFPRKKNANPREEENLKPLSFPIKLWIVVLWSSFDLAFIHF